MSTIHARSGRTASASTATTTARVAAGRLGVSKSAPISAGPIRRPLVDGHAARLSEEKNDGTRRSISRDGVAGRRSRRREYRVFQALRRARLSLAGLRELRPVALSADDRLPLVHVAGVGLEE